MIENNTHSLLSTTTYIISEPTLIGSNNRESITHNNKPNKHTTCVSTLSLTLSLYSYKYIQITHTYTICMSLFPPIYI